MNTELNSQASGGYGIHKFMPEDYPILVKWLLKRNFPVPLYKHLPPTGAMIWQGKTPICAGFLFKTDADLAVLGSLASNPDYKDDRQSHVDFLIKYLIDKAKSDGFNMICCSTKIEKLGKRFEILGLPKFDENVSMYGRVI